MHGTNAAHVTGFGYRDVMERNGDRVRLNESKMEWSEQAKGMISDSWYKWDGEDSWTLKKYHWKIFIDFFLLFCKSFKIFFLYHEFTNQSVYITTII